MIVGAAGLPRDTIPTDAVGAQIGVLLDHQEPALGNAVVAAFDLD